MVWSWDINYKKCLFICAESIGSIQKVEPNCYKVGYCQSWQKVVLGENCEERVEKIEEELEVL